MYTRCPECHTAFRITVAQLKARDGQVRCGRCDSVFRADLQLFAPPTKGGKARKGEAEDELYLDLGDLEEPSDTLELGEEEIPVISDLSIFQAPRHGPPMIVWFIGVLIAAVALSGQFAYFYRDELAQIPEVRPYLSQFCKTLQCRFTTPANLRVPDVVQTQISPHPRYMNALRIRVEMANHTNHTLTLPLLQVSLTDNNGKLLARRTFGPRVYLASPVRASAPLSPNIAVTALLDITNPNSKASGYEVQLFPQLTTQPN